MPVLNPTHPTINVDLEVLPLWNPSVGREATPERRFTQAVRQCALSPTFAAFRPFLRNLTYSQLRVRIVPTLPISSDDDESLLPFAITVRVPRWDDIAKNMDVIFSSLLTGFGQSLLQVSKKQHLTVARPIVFALVLEQGWVTHLNDTSNEIHVLGDTPPPAHPETFLFPGQSLAHKPPNAEKC